jgi:hypothetical protein
MDDYIQNIGVMTPKTRGALVSSILGAIEDALNEQYESIIRGAITNFEDKDDGHPVAKVSVAIAFSLEHKPKAQVKVSHAVRKSTVWDERIDPDAEQQEFEMEVDFRRAEV